MKLKIGARLWVVFGILMFLSCLTIGVGILQLNEASASSQSVIEKPLAKERLISEWYRYIYMAKTRTTAIAKSQDVTLAAFFAEEQKNSASTTSKIVAQVEQYLESDDEKKLYAEIKAYRAKYTELRDKVIQTRSEGKHAEADALLEKEFVPAAEIYMATLQKLLTRQQEALNHSVEPIKEANDRAKYYLLVLGAILMGSTCVLGALVIRSIVKPLHEAVNVANTVASGDLRSTITVSSRHDETGELMESLQKMQSNLVSAIEKMRNVADQVASASVQIASGTHDLSQRTEHAASNIQQTMNSIDEFAQAIQNSTESTQNGATLSNDSVQQAQHGGKVVQSVVVNMQKIHQHSQKISDIIGVIDGIAFQTNILALNAAVEAARAGEQGRGFAVVAGEVRALAKRSADAAKEIKDLITSSVSDIKVGTSNAEEAGRAMSDIIHSIERVTSLMQVISENAGEQSRNVNVVHTSMVSLDTSIQRNAAMVEESAASAQNLQEQARELQELVQTFKC